VSEIAGAWVDWGADPAVDTRVLWIPIAFDEATVQDILDTCRAITDEISALDKPRLVFKSGGEEPLRGGVSVGLTLTLWNCQVAFAARVTPDTTGTVTTQSIPGTLLIDSSGQFETDLIERGAIIINRTDGSKCTVLRVIDEGNIRCTALAGGSDNQFDIGDSYEIVNVVTCDISGGNLVARDYADVEMGATLATFGTQINLAASSSATLSEQEALQYSSYGGVVSVDTTSSTTGTNYPAGNKEYPVNNLVDALAICTDKGFDTLYIIGDITLGAGHDVSGKVIRGQNSVLSTITVEAAANTLRTTFKDCTMTGVLDGDSLFQHCVVGDLTYVEGFIFQCTLGGTITLAGTEMTNIVDCNSGIAGTSTPVVDMGGSGRDLGVRNYSGGIKIINMDGDQNISLDFSSGSAIIDSTVTNGTVDIRGVVTVTDNSGPGCTVITDGALNRQTITATQWDTVWVDTVDGQPGTVFPLGHQSSPVDNIADAELIAAAYGLERYHIRGSIVLENSFTGCSFLSHSSLGASIDLNGQDVTGAAFSHMTLTGVQNGVVSCYNCKLNAVTSMEGEYIDCIVATNLDCKTGVWTYLWGGAATEASMFTVNMNGGAMVGITKCTLVCAPQNMTEAGAIFLKHGQGLCSVDGSNTNGTIRLGGETGYIDSGGETAGVFVQDDTTRQATATTVWNATFATEQEAKIALIEKILRNKMVQTTDSSNNHIIYDDDGVTPLLTFTVKDSGGLAPTLPTGVPATRTRGV
jgi:hypothetical protein